MTPFNYLFTALVLVSLSLHATAQDIDHQYFKRGPEPTKLEAGALFFGMVNSAAKTDPVVILF